MKCPFCSSTDTLFKAKAGRWECQACEERFDSSTPVELLSQPPGLSDKAGQPKRIFFSYGHDANRELVDRFKEDLEKRGHSVWVDYKEIGAWDDWRGSITQGIHDSQLAIAFLSLHSTRDPGVCRNEVAMALHHFGTVYPVLVEQMPLDSIPVTIAHLQWPDLSQWRDIRDGVVDGMDFERYYEEKLLEIVSRVEGDATRFASEAAVLRRVLKPSSFEGKFAQHLDGFMGREWVFEAFEVWLNQQPESRVFWLKAGPGFGKTALAVNLANRYRAAVVGTWFCDEQSIELRDPLRAVCTLAFQLALRWDDYRARLLPRLGLFAGSPEAQIAEALESLSKKNLSDLFSHLISEPLAGLIWREHKLVILIDALDEATEVTGQNALSALISGKFLELPKWISFVVTSRPDASVVGHLQRFKPYEIASADARNTHDLAHYSATRIGALPELAGLDAARRDQVCLNLVEKSEGMILYLRMVEEGLREGTLQVDDLEKMQSGLGGLYSRYYQTFEHRFGSDFANTVRPLLRLIMASPGPLPLDLATEVLDMDKESTRKMRLQLGSYLTEASQGLTLFHKTLGEWLNSDTSGQFVTYPSSARKHLGDYLWKCFEGRTEDEYGITKPVHYEAHVLEWLPEMIEFTTQTNDPDTLSLFGKFLKARLHLSAAELLYRKAWDASAMLLGAESPETLIHAHRFGGLLLEKGEYKNAEEICLKVLGQLREVFGNEHEAVLTTLSSLGMICLMRENFPAAEHLIRKSLEGFERLLGPENEKTLEEAQSLVLVLCEKRSYDEAETECRHVCSGREKALGCEHPDTLYSLAQLGDVLLCKDSHQEAESIYRRVMDARNRALGAGHPSTLESLTDLATVIAANGDHEAALQMLKKAMEGFEKVFGPEHKKTLDAVIKIADLLSNIGDINGAIALQKRAANSFERTLGFNHPSSLGSFGELGVLLYSTGELDAAEIQLRRVIQGFESLLGTEDSYALYYLNQLGMVLQEKGQMDEAESLYRRTLDGFEKRLGLEDPRTRDSIQKLACLLDQKGNPEEAANLLARLYEAGDMSYEPPEDNDAARAQMELAAFFVKHDKLEAAAVLSHGLLKFWESTLGPDDSNTLHVVAFLGSLKNRRGSPGEAALLLSTYVDKSAKALALLRYNLACYECLSGNEERARQLVTDELSTSAEPSARKARMLEDSDFQVIHDFIRSIPVS